MKLHAAGRIEPYVDACATIIGTFSTRPCTQGITKIGTSCRHSARYAAEFVTRSVAGIRESPSGSGGG